MVATLLNCKESALPQELDWLDLLNHSKSSKNKKFKQLVRELDSLTNRVKNDWHELAYEEKQLLKDLAYRLLNPPTGMGDETDLARKNLYLRRLQAWWKVFIAALTGQLGEMVEVVIASDRLAHAIVDAVDEEESDTTAKFLDFLMKDIKDNPSKLVPYTQEMDAKLEDLLSGIEIDP